ncbi:hypothetical protein ACVWZ6_000424 [Bradyrhizobium sp. GM6.1]
MRFTIERPSPIPSSAGRLPRKNGSNIRSMSPDGVPGPVSSICTTFLARAVDPNVDPSAVRREAHGIVEQVAYHRRDHHGLALDRDWFNQLEAKIYSLARRLWHQIRHQILHGAV